jgi:hypothetical protein
MTNVFKTYKCHKVVEAAKIAEVRAADGDGKTLFFAADDGTMVQAVVDAAFVAKHNPQAGGYVVKYAGGYESYSPGEPFETGYDLVEPETVTQLTVAGEVYETGDGKRFAVTDAKSGQVVLVDEAGLTDSERSAFVASGKIAPPVETPAPAAEAPAAEVAAAPAEETKRIVGDATADADGSGEQAPAPAPVAEVKAEETPAA